VTTLDSSRTRTSWSGADGSNSFVASGRCKRGFSPKIELLTNRFAWYGTTRPFDCLTLTFRGNEHGAFVAHHYRHARGMSTFVVECNEAPGKKRGWPGWTTPSRARTASGYSHRISTGTLWSEQVAVAAVSVVIQPELFSGKFVLIGDALAHGPFLDRLRNAARVRDAIALDRAFGEAGEDVPRALAAFEREAGRSWKNCSPLRNAARIGTSVFRKRCARRLAPRLRLHDEERRMTDSRLARAGA